ncbi:hypothetical protein QTG54_008451 [Skeletonema marinoi]|uniref:Uncharacterized protein n=1 Tax=Skeletonema marinoi TaxID=267567 RepID=A0AAD8Y8Y2_9STRA|nr:hypothetical protein QTG54_008451 [Skeletonema marinoi]
MNNGNNIIMHHQLFTPVRVQAGEQAATIQLAPRPSAATLLPEALSSGPSFPCLDTAPSIPHELSMLDSEGDQGDGGSNYRGRSCSRDSHKQRVRSLAPPKIIRLRPRFTHFYPSNNDHSSAVVGNAIVSQSSSFDPSRMSRGTKNPDLVDDMQSMRRSSLLDGQVNRSSFPRAA